MPKSAQANGLGAFSFDPETEVLRGPDGAEVALRPQTRQVLALLVRHAGTLVSKDRLMAEVWPDTHVTDDSLVQCISEIRKALGADGGRLRTVPKQGYRLELSAPSEAGVTGRRRLILAVVVVIALVGLAGAWMLRPHPAPARLHTIAVLPFENIGADDTYAYFTNGITEDLVVSLSKIPDLAVIARSTAAAVAGEAEDPREVARRLRADYVVDGSLRRVGDALKMTAALVEAETGETAWAESYDGDVAEIFDFQDAVLDEIVRVLAVRLSPAERERLGIHGTDDIAAYDAYLRGMELQNFLTPQANRDAEAAFREAIRRDPDYAAAHAYLSLVLSNAAEYGWTEDEAAAVDEALQQGARAIALDPELPFAHFAMGRLKSRAFVSDFDGALAAFRTAIGLKPNYYDAYAFMANVLVFSGHADEALAAIEDVMARNPRPPYWYYVPLGLANFYLGNEEAAEAALQEVLKRNPNSPHAMRTLIALYGRMGDPDEAQWVAGEYEALGHPATVSAMTSDMSVRHPPYVAALTEGLRMAGLPE